MMKKPYTIINAAMTVDGKIDTYERQGATISSAEDKMRVLALRAEMDAVLVGGKTLNTENPKLTVKLPELMQKRREAGLPENPAKVGISSQIRIDPQGDFVMAGPARRILFTTPATPTATIDTLEKLGIEVHIHSGERVDLIKMMETLSTFGFKKILLEGGSTIIAEFIRLGLADELQVYLAAKIFGGENSPALVGGAGWPASMAKTLKLENVQKIDQQGGLLIRYLFSK